MTSYPGNKNNIQIEGYPETNNNYHSREYYYIVSEPQNYKIKYKKEKKKKTIWKSLCCLFCCLFCCFPY